MKDQEFFNWIGQGYHAKFLCLSPRKQKLVKLMAQNIIDTMLLSQLLEQENPDKHELAVIAEVQSRLQETAAEIVTVRSSGKEPTDG